jgi:hypothetical protein
MDDADSGEDRGERAQTGPIPALAATVVVGAALALYASTLYGVFPSTSDPRVAEPTLERATEAVVDDGIARPDDLANALDAAPAGYDAAVVLVADDERWRVGPASPPDAASAARPVSVRVAPGVVVAGRLRVEVWR